MEHERESQSDICRYAIHKVIYDYALCAGATNSFSKLWAQEIDQIVPPISVSLLMAVSLSEPGLVMEKRRGH